MSKPVIQDWSRVTARVPTGAAATPEKPFCVYCWSHKPAEGGETVIGNNKGARPRFRCAGCIAKLKRRAA